MKMLFSGKIFTIPNFLSAFRICLIPIFVRLYLGQNNLTATVLILVLSGVTDVLDGIIARHFDMVSDFGKALDPFADKLTQVAMLCCLTIRFPRMLWLILLLCVKEIFVAATGLAVIHKREKVLGAAWHGKLTTVLLYAAMILHLLWIDLPDSLSWGLILSCMAMVLFSGILYGVRNLRAVQEGNDAQD